MIKKLIFVISILFFFLSFDFVLSQSQDVTIYFFYSELCPYCAKEKEFLKELKLKYPKVEIKEYELTYQPENKKVLKDFFEKYQVPQNERKWVPVTFTPNKYFIGFNDQIGKEIENCLKECFGQNSPLENKIRIPFFGGIDISQMPLPVLSVVFGALDGFNPCAMWVLLLLIALLMNTRSRKRMWLVGGTFVLASGIVYFLLLSAWLNLFLAISYVNLTRIAIGVFALGMGGWQIRSFFTKKSKTCEVIDGKSSLQIKIKNGLKNHAKKIAVSPLTFGILAGVVILAIAVNLVEFFCSAGLPAIFTRILALSQLTALQYYSYLLLYTLFFMLDDLIVLSLAIFALSKITFTEKYNYWATLIGGLLIFLLGLLLIFKPAWLMFG